jgi:hypothetical protein
MFGRQCGRAEILLDGRGMGRSLFLSPLLLPFYSFPPEECKVMILCKPMYTPGAEGSFGERMRVLALLAVLCVVGVALVVTAGRHVELVGKATSPEHATLVAKLKSLLKTLTPIGKPHGGATSAKAGGEAKGKWSSLQLAKAACQDGEPCKLGQSQMPEMRYNPESGNWDFISAGNPTAVWHSLMQAAKKRDNSNFGRAQAANLRAEENAEMNKEGKKSVGGMQTQQLLEVEARGRSSSASARHRQLEDELKSLLEAKAASHASLSGGDEQGGGEGGFGGEGSLEMQDPTTAWAYQLAAHLRTAVHVINGHVGGAGECEELVSRLSKLHKVREVCRHPRLATEALGVFQSSSLTGCERQVKVTVGDLVSKLKSRAAMLRERRSPEGGGVMAPELEDRRGSLTSELTGLKKNHRELEDELASQERRIKSLSRARNAVTSPPAPPGLPPHYRPGLHP